MVIRPRSQGTYPSFNIFFWLSSNMYHSLPFCVSNYVCLFFWWVDLVLLAPTFLQMSSLRSTLWADSSSSLDTLASSTFAQLLLQTSQELKFDNLLYVPKFLTSPLVGLVNPLLLPTFYLFPSLLHSRDFNPLSY